MFVETPTVTANGLGVSAMVYAGVTVTVELAMALLSEAPPVAVIVVVPGATPVTTAVAVMAPAVNVTGVATVAIPGLDETSVTVAPPDSR